MDNKQTSKSDAPKHNIPVLLQIPVTVAGGGLLILAYPPFGYWPCVILAWTGFFIVVLKGSARSSFYLGLAFGLISYGGALPWFRTIFAGGSVLLYALLSIFVMLPALLSCHFSRRFKSPWLKALLLSSLFASFEFFRCELFTLKFPWISAGSALPPNWLTPIIGVYGCSFLVFAASALLSIKGTRLAGSGLIVLLTGLYFFKPPFIVPKDSESIKAAVIQGEELNFEEYVSLSKKMLCHSPRLIAWPEYSLPYDVRKQEPKQIDELQAIAKAHDTIFVVGTKTTLGEGDREWRNTALTVGGDGVLGEYYKNRPVHFFNDGIAGTTAEPVKTPIGMIGTEICFDTDYESVTRELVRKGAQLLVIPTFDSEAWGETQHKQHSIFFQLRAAENRRWIICSASSGYSRIIDPHGHIHESLPFAKTDAFAGNVVLVNGRTFYNLLGWLTPWGVMLAAIATCLWAAVNSKKNPAD